jgi:hypothetical protein
VIEYRSDWSDRATFGEILNARGLTGEACEIGSHRGDFSYQFLAGKWVDGANGHPVKILNGWLGRKLWCVEPWSASVLHYPGPPPESDGDREKDYEVFTNRMSEFGDRVRVLRMTSNLAANHFQNGQLDFVHVDGDHEYEQVLLDLRNYWPLVRSGGILSGHDWVCPGSPGWAPGIQRAVEKFCEVMDVPVVHLVPEHGQPWSFYLEKP